MTQIETVKKIINSWKEKGDKEIEKFNKFICYWIALNAFYCTYLLPNAAKGRRISDAQYILELKKRLNKYNVSFDKEIKFAQTLEPNIINTTRVKDNEIKVSNIDTLVDFIYTVRNNLFHGNKRDEDERDKKIMEISVPILKKILELVLEKK